MPGKRSLSLALSCPVRPGWSALCAPEPHPVLSTLHHLLHSATTILSLDTRHHGPSCRACQLLTAWRMHVAAGLLLDGAGDIADQKQTTYPAGVVPSGRQCK